MSDDISVKNISKLGGSNYQVWKFQINSLLIANGVYDIVTGDRVQTAETEVSAATHKQ